MSLSKRNLKRINQKGLKKFSLNELNRIRQQLKEQHKEEAKESLLAFTEFTFPEYKANWHHVSYANVLDKFIAGDIKRLMVFMPPQHGKSELCTRRMPAKILGDYPDKRVAVCAYNHTFAAKFNRDIQRIMTTPEYRSLYPGTRLNEKNIRSDASGSWLRNSDEFEIVGRKGSLISVGIGGGITGNKVDVGIVDDPYKDRQQANSKAYNRQLKEWWDEAFETRLDNDAQICLTFTRWKHDDIAGYILGLQEAGIVTEEWTIVKYQGIKDDENDDPLDQRKPGEALWPEKHSAQKHLNMKAKNPSGFEALIQQNPQPKQGRIIKDEHFFRYDPWDLPKELTENLYIDTAQSEKELENNDPTGILRWVKYKNLLYLLEFYKGMWGITDQIKMINMIAENHLNGRHSRIYIENKDNAKSVKNLLKQGTTLSVILDNIKGKKLERVENEEPIFEAVRIGIPNNAVWVPDFMNQIKGFPHMKHDEEVDCLTGTIRMAFNKKSGGYKLMNTKR